MLLLSCSRLARGFDDDGELEVVRKIEPAAKRLGKRGRVDAVKGEDLLRNRLVLRQHQAVRARPRVLLANQLEVARGNQEHQHRSSGKSDQREPAQTNQSLG